MRYDSNLYIPITSGMNLEPFEDWNGKDRRVHCMKMVGETAQLAYKYLQIPQNEAFEMPYGEKMSDNNKK